jgi:hypothetical protein
MRRRGEAAHVGTDLGQDHLRRDRPHAGDRIQLGDRGRQFTDSVLDAGLHGGDVGGDRIHPLQHLREQEGVVIGEPAGQRLGQPGGLGAQTAAGQLGEHRRITLAAMSAAIIARPEAPNGSLTTTDSLISASSSSFSTRCFSAVRTASRSTR